MFGARLAQACPPAIVRSYKDGSFSDLVITCGTLTFKVHILVVCSSCDFFRKNVEFAGKESSEKRIDLPEDDPEMIRRLITYLYLGDYDPSNSWDLLKFVGIDQHEPTTTTNATYHLRTGAYNLSTTDPCACLSPNLKNVAQTSDPLSQDLPADYELKPLQKTAGQVQVATPLSIHATMYALGDKYQVQGLSQLAKEKFESCLHHHVNSEDFVSAVQIAYTSTPDTNRGLRDSVLGAFRAHFNTDVAKIPGAETRLDSIDELSFHLIKSWPTKVEKATPAGKSASRDPPFHSGLFAQPATVSGTSLVATPSASTSSRLPSSTQPAATGGLFGSSNTSAASQPRTGLFGSSPART